MKQLKIYQHKIYKTVGAKQQIGKRTIYMVDLISCEHGNCLQSMQHLAQIYFADALSTKEPPLRMKYWKTEKLASENGSTISSDSNHFLVEFPFISFFLLVLVFHRELIGLPH